MFVFYIQDKKDVEQDSRAKTWIKDQCTGRASKSTGRAPLKAKPCEQAMNATHGLCILLVASFGHFLIRHGRVPHKHDRARLSGSFCCYKLLVSAHYCYVMIVYCLV